MDFITPFAREDFKKTLAGRLIERVSPEARTLLGNFILCVGAGSIDGLVIDGAPIFAGLLQTGLMVSQDLKELRNGEGHFSPSPKSGFGLLSTVTSVSGLMIGYGLTKLAMGVTHPSQHSLKEILFSGTAGAVSAGVGYLYTHRQVCTP